MVPIATDLSSMSVGTTTASAAMPRSIPSPPASSIELGPLELNMYGLCIALGVVAAVWLMGRRLEAKGIGTRDDAANVGVWGVVAGVIGARLYHVATDFEKFRDDLGAIPRLWEGGLGIPGGLLFGISAGMYAAWRRGLPLGLAANCAAPGIALAQAIGRWGNYFNQELFGRPTDLPWALEIDPENAPGYPAGTTFHPTFLYESLWSLLLCVVLLRIDVKFRVGPGQLMALYVAGYGLGRFWVEGLRIDAADELGGLRWNQWVALAAILGGMAAFFLLRARDAAATDVTPTGSDGTVDDGTDDDARTGSDGTVDDDTDDDTGPDDDGPDGIEPGSDVSDGGRIRSASDDP